MARRDFPPDAPLPHGNRWRAPADPAKIRPERRKPAPVNADGFGPTRTVNDLTPTERKRYNAQLAAFRAAHELTVVSHHATEYGMPVPRDAVRAWTTARRRWVGILNSRTLPSDHSDL